MRGGDAISRLPIARHNGFIQKIAPLGPDQILTGFGKTTRVNLGEEGEGLSPASGLTQIAYPLILDAAIVEADAG